MIIVCIRELSPLANVEQDGILFHDQFETGTLNYTLRRLIVQRSANSFALADTAFDGVRLHSILLIPISSKPNPRFKKVIYA